VRFLVSSLLAVAVTLNAAAAPSGPLLLDAAAAGNSILAVGERGLITRSTDGGMSWQPLEAIVPQTLTAITFADERNGWAVGHGAVILRTTDGGQRWSLIYTGPDTESPLLDVLALNSSHIIAIGSFGSFFESHDAGATWEQRWILEEDMHLNRISTTQSGTLFIAGEFGVLLRSKDQGANWDTLSTGEDGSLYGVLPLSDGSLLAYGLRGRVYLSSDDGDNWESIETPGTGLLMTGIELAAANTVILTGQGRTWWVSQDRGRTYQASSEITPAVAELLLTPSGRLLTFGEDGARPALNTR
jgi:photosystem II stability/assembly factor-like uncharacterized protein